MADPHFDALARDYDRLRTGGGQWRELADQTLAALGSPRRLLDVGCGTGRFAVYAAEQLGARVWAVDPSAQMLDQARAQNRPVSESAGARRRSRRCPFKDGWFDAAHMHLVLHLLADRPAAIAQLARVTAAGARLAIVSFHLDHFETSYLNQYFPSIPAIDLARFPDPAGSGRRAQRGRLRRRRRSSGSRCRSARVDPTSSSECAGATSPRSPIVPDDEYRARPGPPRTRRRRWARHVRAPARVGPDHRHPWITTSPRSTSPGRRTARLAELGGVRRGARAGERACRRRSQVCLAAPKRRRRRHRDSRERRRPHYRQHVGVELDGALWRFVYAGDTSRDAPAARWFEVAAPPTCAVVDPRQHRPDRRARNRAPGDDPKDGPSPRAFTFK